MSAELEMQVGKGMQAEEFMNHPLMQEFFITMEQVFLQNIKSSGALDYEGREENCKMLRLLDSFKKMLEHYAMGGKVAADMLKRVSEGKFNNI